jgi:hypothetical protein
LSDAPRKTLNGFNTRAQGRQRRQPGSFCPAEVGGALANVYFAGAGRAGLDRRFGRVTTTCFIALDAACRRKPVRDTPWAVVEAILRRCPAGADIPIPNASPAGRPSRLKVGLPATEPMGRASRQPATCAHRGISWITPPGHRNGSSKLTI